MNQNRIPCADCGHSQILHRKNSSGTTSCFECVEWLNSIRDTSDYTFVHEYRPNNLGYLGNKYDEDHPKIYLLWFNEIETNYVLGVFKTKEEAEFWREYFLKNPKNEYSSSMEWMAHDEEDYAYRLKIEEREIGTLHPEIKIDNLKYLEMKHDKKKG